MNTGNVQEMEISEETHRAVLKMMRKERKQIKKEVKNVERQKEEERKKLELKFGPTDNRVRIISREFASKLIGSHKSQTNNCEFLQLTPDDFPSLDQNVYKSKNITDMNSSTLENGVTTERCVSSSIDRNVSNPIETNVPSPEPMNISKDKNYNVLGDPNDIDMSALGELDFIFTEVVPKKPRRTRGKRGAGSRKRRPRYRIKYDKVSENCSNDNGTNVIESTELNQYGFTELIQSASKELNQSGSKELNRSGSKELNQSGFTELIQSASKELNQAGFRKLIQFGFKELNQSASKGITVTEDKDSNLTAAKEPNLSLFKELRLSQPIRINLSRPKQFNLYKTEELNISGPNEFNLSQPTELNLPGSSQFNLYNPDEFNIPGPNEFNLSDSKELNLPGPNEFNLYNPEEFNIPGPNEFNLSEPKKINLSGPNEFNLCKPQKLYTPAPNELSVPGPSKFNSSVPKEINVSEPNEQVIKKTKRVNFGPVTVNILDILQKSKSQLKKEEQLKREANIVKQRTRKFRQREAKKNERYEGNMLDASQPDRQRGKHREFAKKRQRSKLKQLIERDEAEAEEEARKEVAEVEPYPGKPKYSEFHINYSNNVITEELDSAVTAFLTNIVQFQEKLYERDPIKGDKRRRYFVGFKVVRKFLLLKKIKILVVSPDIKAKRRGDTLDNMINNIVSLAAASEIPYVFALSRHKMGQITLKNVPICCVAVADCDGTEKEFEKVLELIQVTRDEYQKTKPTPLDAQEEQRKEIIDDFLSFV